LLVDKQVPTPKGSPLPHFVAAKRREIYRPAPIVIVETTSAKRRKVVMRNMKISRSGSAVSRTGSALLRTGSAGRPDSAKGPIVEETEIDFWPGILVRIHLHP